MQQLEVAALRYLMPWSDEIKKFANGNPEDFVGSDNIARPSQLSGACSEDESIEVHDFDFDIASVTAEEASSYEVVFVFHRGDEYLCVDVSYPSYCDDESDGYLNRMERMSKIDIEEMLRKRITRIRDSVESFLTVLDKQVTGALGDTRDLPF